MPSFFSTDWYKKHQKQLANNKTASQGKRLAASVKQLKENKRKKITSEISKKTHNLTFSGSETKLSPNISAQCKYVTTPRN